jgi:hypothetical protein
MKNSITSTSLDSHGSQFINLFTYRRARHLIMAKAFGDFQNAIFSKSESQEPQLNKVLGRSASIRTDNQPITILASPELFRQSLHR